MLAPAKLIIQQPTFTLRTEANLSPGWHRLRLHLDTPTRTGIRKQLSLQAGDQTIAALAWNDTLIDDFLFRLEEPAQELQLVFRHAQGPLTLSRFSLRRVSSLRTTWQAVRAKVKLLRQFNCIGPVLGRGTQLLLQGDLTTFRRKLLKGLPDSRVMKLEAKRAEEAGGAWWRRRALPTEQIEALRRECDALDDPLPIAVILPADPTRIDHARQAAFSVLRQIYPHWQLRILWPAGRAPAKITGAIRHDNRAAIIVGDYVSGLRRVLVEVPCDRVLVLSPDAELAEDGLFRLARLPDARLSEHAVWLDLHRLAVELPETLPPIALSVVRWAGSLTPANDASPLVYALDGGRDPSLAGLPPLPKTRSIHLAGNFSGISGWDAVAYQTLKGLSSSGVAVRRHEHTPLRSHTLPPGLEFQKAPRHFGDPLLIVAPPYQLKSFAPDVSSAVFTMWECDRLPAASVHYLNQARVVIVPSRWGAETFRASGVTVPLEIVPLGYDPQIFHPRGPTPKICTFGTAGALGAGGLRKNIRMVIDAFRAAFPDKTDVLLRIKLTPNCTGLDFPDDPRIDVTQAVLPPGEVAAWYRSLTAYVNASYAEGFGLHLLEAMACGVPLISTDVSGPADYLDANVGFILPHRKIRAKNDVYDGHWYEPDFEAMVATLCRVHREGAGARAIHAAARARRYTWRDMGRSLLTVLRKYDLL